MDDPRQAYAAALDHTAKLVAGVAQGQLDLPTPCAEYTVRQLLGHLVGGLNRAAHVGAGGKALDVPAHVAGVPDDGWPAAYAEAAERVLAAWADDATLDRVYQVPWGAVPGAGVLTAYTQEVLTHGWDLAKATGPPPDDGDPALAERAYASARRFVPAEPRGGPIPFDAPVDVPADAGPYTRLAAWLGRRP